MTRHNIDDHVTPNPCPRRHDCGVAMWLRRIEREEPYYERIIYACPSCNSRQTFIARYNERSSVN